MNEQETTDDIIAEMRRIRVREFQDYADRLDAAYRREKAAIEADALSVGGIVGATAEKSSVAGNFAALREALQKAAESAAEIMERVRHKDGLAFNTANYIAGVARTALAAPPRNCDVGTAEEQDARYNKLCEPLRSCGQCPVYVKAQGVDHCEFAWAQMPYEDGGAK